MSLSTHLMHHNGPQHSPPESFELSDTSMIIPDESSIPLMADQENLKDVGDPGSPEQHASPHYHDDPARPPSLDDIYRMEGRSLYDKKCMIVNREIERMGMGRYQWCVWGLCGLGYFIDLLWAQAFSLVMKPTQQEFGYGGA